MSAQDRRQINVVLDADFNGGACRVGTLFHTAAHGKSVFSFAYDSEWLRRPDVFEIDPDLQLHGGEIFPETDAGVFRVFLDSSPDRWGRLLLDRRELLRAREAQRRPHVLSEWDYLLGVHDECRMGALRFRENKNSPFLDNDSQLAAPPLASLREIEAASLALEAPGATEKANFSRWLTALLAPGSSLGGARPKANFTAPDGSLWISKFPSREDRRDVGAWEMLARDLAESAGIDVPRAQLLKLGSRHRTYACQRFDRTRQGRRFFVSAMTLLSKADGQAGSYLELAEFLSTRGSVSGRAADLRQLWTRVVFNILVSNTDDHLRNHGFILDSSGWRLAPAYDVNPSVERRIHALAIDESDATPDIGLALSTAEYYGLKTKEAENVLRHVREAVAGWATLAKKLRLPREQIDLMANAFEHA